MHFFKEGSDLYCTTSPGDNQMFWLHLESTHCYIQPSNFHNFVQPLQPVVKCIVSM